MIERDIEREGVPWESPANGLFEGFWLTLTRATFSPRRLHEQAVRTASDSSARSFLFVCSVLAAIAVLVTNLVFGPEDRDAHRFPLPPLLIGLVLVPLNALLDAYVNAFVMNKAMNWTTGRTLPFATVLSPFAYAVGAMHAWMLIPCVGGLLGAWAMLAGIYCGLRAAYDAGLGAILIASTMVVVVLVGFAAMLVGSIVMLTALF